MSLPGITVCVPTYKRPLLLGPLLQALFSQATQLPGAAGPSFTFDIVVADDDPLCSGQPVVESHRAHSPVRMTYCPDPANNIARIRNTAIRHAAGDFIAFIDDDEIPASDWLLTLFTMLTRHSPRPAGVLAPVRPRFEVPPPAWVLKGRFCERPEHPTGTVMRWLECRTGNVLFARSIVDSLPEPFDPAFATGGEDKDFFRRMIGCGHTFIWCNEAPVYESVPASRLTASYMLHRALLRGRNTLKISSGRFTGLAKSLVAIPVYSFILPVALLFGRHHFMKYLIKFCDHSGRLLALFGLNPVTERQM